jgi:hypothetical protein
MQANSLLFFNMKGGVSMNAIHVNWTKPYGRIHAEDFEILTTILSALKWREKNGSIKLITDSNGAQYYVKNGLDIIWDLGIDDCLEDMVKGINPEMFWAAGKIFALSCQSTPIAVIDTDFIVWEKLDFDLFEDAAVIHFEDLYPDVYPNKDYFKMKSGYEFRAKLDWNVKACNTAFYVIKNKKFLESYTTEAIRFMKNSKDVDDNLRYMVFAEQRLFSMCAKAEGIKIAVFSDLNALFSSNNLFTHTWGMKQQMRDMPTLRADFCRRCIRRIYKDYPDMVSVISKIDCLKGYFG